MNISATLIRDRIQSGHSVRYLLPDSVQSFIISNNLYKMKGKPG
jgi:nicotinate-nucleotide adenylyltransferase